MATVEVERERLPRQPTMNRFSINDIRAETLSTIDPQLGERDYTDDLEDLVNMSVTSQLASRKSHQTLSHTPSFPSLPYEYNNNDNNDHRGTPSAPVKISNSTSPSPSPSSPHADPSSFLPSPVMSTQQRSLIPRLGSVSPPQRNGATMGDHHHRGGGGRGIMNGVEMVRGNSDPGTMSPPSRRDDDEENDDRDRWETLQVGDRGTREAGGQHSPRITTTTTKRSHSPNTPSRTTPRTSSTHTGGAPASTSTSSSPAAVRKRAQTQNLPKTRPSRGGLVGAASTSSSSPRTPTSNTPNSASRKPGTNRTNYTPSPTIPKKPTSTPPIRRKSISTSRDYPPRSTSSYTFDAMSSDFAFDPTAPLPHWAKQKTPLVFRTSKGELDFHSDRHLLQGNGRNRIGGGEGGGEGTEEGMGMIPKGKKFDDLIVPTVARRLEAERLLKMVQEQDKDGAEGGGGGWVVDEWGTDGLPRSARNVRDGRKKVVGENSGFDDMQEDTRVGGEGDHIGDVGGEGRQEVIVEDNDRSKEINQHQHNWPDRSHSLATQQPPNVSNVTDFLVRPQHEVEKNLPIPLAQSGSTMVGGEDGRNGETGEKGKGEKSETHEDVQASCCRCVIS